MKNIFIALSIFVFGQSYAQTATENYIQSREYLEPVTNTSTTAKQIETVQYFDGLGRPKQIVNVKATPSGKDVVTPIEYDAAGRQLKNYLPLPQGGTQNGNIYSTPFNNVTAIFGSEKIYSEKVLENSPFDRVLEQKQIGNDWNGKSVKFKYDTNTAEDKVRKFATPTSWSNNATQSGIANAGIYGEGQLYKNIVTDEDGNTTIEFKNGKGQVLLVRKVISAAENADTYYIYNDYDQLVFVFPPLLSKLDSWGMPEHDALAYQYRYDGKGRLVEKKLPGKDWEFMVYDTADRIILFQDANLRKSFDWIIYKYDVLERPIYTGIVKSNNSRIGMQNQILGGPIIEGRDNTPLTANGMPYYYTNMHWGLNTLLSVTYYDSYPQQYGFNPPVPSTILGEPVLTDVPNAEGRSTKDLPVLSLVKNVEDDGWTKTYTYYDRKGRVIGTHSINHLGGYTHTESKLDFAGLAQQTITRHKRLASDTEKVITETFEYDHQNRLLAHKHQVDGNTTEILTQNTYNEISQISGKKVGGTDTANPLQTIDYKYNIRGWMTQINDPANLGNDLFGYKIKYTDPVVGNYHGRFNGNIAEVDWKAATDGQLRRYNYTYDRLNRFVHAIYLKPDASVVQTSAYNEWVDYDLNGNIIRLDRYGDSDGNGPLQIDRLYYTYSGNRLSKVEDTTQNPSGYPYVPNPNTIDYDDNGNMTSYMDKGISAIQYNYLNLPRKITQNSKIIDYTYRTDGVKVKKVFDTKTTDYLDGFQYENSNLKFFPTTEGYFNVETGKYVYNYTDHLGNVRLSYTKNGAGTEIIEESNYYPFGLKHEGYNVLTGNSAYKYKYNGKELQETGMYDYGARMYMPDLGRWGVVDPLAEFEQSFSPYAYVYNNPLRLTDPSGMLGSGGGDPEDEPQIASEKFGTDNNPIKIDEIVLTGVSGTHLRNNSLSYLGINSLDAYHDSQDRLAFGIRNSAAALATEKFETNLAITMGTFLMGGTNLAGSAAWSAFDAILSYQDAKTQNRVAAIQAIALVIQIKHGNLNAAKKVLQEAAQLEGKAAYSVYNGFDAAGKLKYVGITKREPALRWAEHAAGGGEKGALFFRTVDGATGLSKAEARVMEQNFINQFGLQKGGGQLLNKVNSIAPSNWKNFSGIISPSAP